MSARALSGRRMLDDETIKFRQRVIDRLVVGGAIGYLGNRDWDAFAASALSAVVISCSVSVASPSG